MNCAKLAAAFVFVFIRPVWAVEPVPMEVTDDVMAVAKSSNEFATDLYAHLRSSKPSDLFFSPYSVSMALAMTYAGATGETNTEMAKVLHFVAPEARLHPAFDKLRRLLTASNKTPGFQLRIANRLWGQKGFHFLPQFVQVTNANYGAELGLLDFEQSEAARKTVNTWIEEQTDKKIRDVLAPGVINANTRLVLTNAIYFKARWMHEFSKSATTDAPFHISGAKQISTPTMHQTHRLRYGESDNVQLLELPYCETGNLSMLILLPRKIDGLNDLEKLLTSENLQKWVSVLQSRLVKVHLPKFKMTSEFSLKDALEVMGMSLAFSGKADFSGMSTEEQLFLSAVVHKAFVDINEEGTEAAAATAVAVRATAAFPEPEEPIEFRADHPFMFLIRDNRTQIVLFIGSLLNPKT